MNVNEQFIKIVNNFGIWLKILSHDEVAVAIGCPVSRVDKYGRLGKEELMKKLTLDEVVKIEKYIIEKYNMNFTDAPNVQIKKVLTVNK
nr:MAG TPA: hypothetical protein [Caudoviricetes sp.]